MIRVTIYQNEKKECAGFLAKGHAGFSEAGQDIVCAAVSVLVINTVNSIERFTEDKTSCISDEETGSIQFRFRNTPTHDASLLFDSMLSGLEAIEENSEYEPYIDIIFKEV